MREKSHQREQVFFEAEIDPSLQTNFPPLQWDTPPLLPEHGVFAARAGATAQLSARAQAMIFIMSALQAQYRWPR